MVGIGPGQQRLAFLRTEGGGICCLADDVEGGIGYRNRLVAGKPIRFGRILFFIVYVFEKIGIRDGPHALVADAFIAHIVGHAFAKSHVIRLRVSTGQQLRYLFGRADGGPVIGIFFKKFLAGGDTHDARRYNNI